MDFHVASVRQLRFGETRYSRALHFLLLEAMINHVAKHHVGVFDPSRVINSLSKAVATASHEYRSVTI